jgi:hypothetical protein
MKNYKKCEKEDIGYSEIATLVLAGCRGEEGLKTEQLCFGADGAYYAYIADSETEIGEHYKKTATFNHWLKIYDDETLRYEVDAKEINIYRAGDFGCIIQIIK